jgi:hypothetical protein
MFGGQLMSFGHESVALQSITQTPPVHVPFGQPSVHSAFGSIGFESGVAESGATPAHAMSIVAAHQPSAVHT